MLQNKKANQYGFIPMMIMLVAILVAVIVVVYIRVQRAG